MVIDRRTPGLSVTIYIVLSVLAPDNFCFSCCDASLKRTFYELNFEIHIGFQIQFITTIRFFKWNIYSNGTTSSAKPANCRIT